VGTSNSRVAVDCPHCGAGYELSEDRTGFMCTSCGVSSHFWSCPACNCAQQIAQTNPNAVSGCIDCGVSSTVAKWHKNPAHAVALKPQSARLFPGADVDPAQRAVSGIVTAASVPGLWPGSRCVIVFAAPFVAVFGGNGEILRVDYSEVSSLEVGGLGTRRYSTNAGIIGGGFGVTGALEGMALASFLNAATTRTTMVHDTTLSFRAGPSAVLMNADLYEPSTLRVILSPAYHRIEQAASHGQRGLPAAPPGWYPNPDGSETRRYWNGSKWTEHYA
jgi:hypothetical protein